MKMDNRTGATQLTPAEAMETERIRNQRRTALQIENYSLRAHMELQNANKGINRLTARNFTMRLDLTYLQADMEILRKGMTDIATHCTDVRSRQIARAALIIIEGNEVRRKEKWSALRAARKQLESEGKTPKRSAEESPTDERK